MICLNCVHTCWELTWLMRSPRRTGIDSQQMVMNRADPLLTSNSRSTSEICNQWSKTYRFVASLEMFFMSWTVAAIAAFLAQESPKSQSRRFCRPWAFCARNAWGPSTIGQGLGEAGAPKSTSLFPEKLGFGGGGTSSFGRFRCEAQEKGCWNVLLSSWFQ